MQNTVLFPLGQSKYKTPAASPLPGHLLAVTRTTGYWIAVSLVLRLRDLHSSGLITRTGPTGPCPQSVKVAP